MARRTVIVTSKPAAEPLILAEAKAWMKVDGTDDDPLIAALITAAWQAAEQYLRRSLVTQTLRLTLDLCGSGLNDMLGEGVYDLPSSALYGALPSLIELPKPPIQSISSVVTYDLSNTSSTFDSDNYYLNGTRLALNQDAVWPSSLRPVGACEITYVAGYGGTSTDIPQPIKSAMLMHIQRMYDGRIVCDMPEGCQQLLRHYRVMDGLAHG